MQQPRVSRFLAHPGPSLLGRQPLAELFYTWPEEPAELDPSARTALLSLAARHPRTAGPGNGLEEASVARPGIVIGSVAAALQRALRHALPVGQEVLSSGLGHAAFPWWDADTAWLAGGAALRLVGLAQAAAPAEELTAALDRFFVRADDIALSESTQRLMTAAAARGVPWQRLVSGRGIQQLGQGARQQHLISSYTPATSYTANYLAMEKDLSARVFQRYGLPAPRNQVVRTLEQALQAATGLGYPVVLKPKSGAFGTGVWPDIRDEAELRKAFAAVQRYGALLVEQMIPGEHTRLLVINGRCLSAVNQVPAQVTGDGHRSIRALVEATNASRTTVLSSSFKKIAIDSELEDLLAREGLTVDSVPEPGRKVVLRRTSNASRGATVANSTAAVHPDNLRLAERAAAVIGLDIAGIDFITPDISRSWREVGGGICEINSGPGFYMREPDFRLEEALLEGLFPGHDGRIPLVCLLAEADREAREIMSVLEVALRRRGPGSAVAWAGGLAVNGLLALGRGERTLTAALRLALAEPTATAVLAHLTPAAVRAEGLGFDRCELAVLGPGAAQDAAVAALLTSCARRTLESADPQRLAAAVAELP